LGAVLVKDISVQVDHTGSPSAEGAGMEVRQQTNPETTW